MDLKMLKDVIDSDIRSKCNRYTARELYYPECRGGGGDINTYSNGQIYTVKTKDNCIQINHLKAIITQKVDYVLSKPTNNNMKLFNMDEILSIMLQDASLDAVSWLHLFINEVGALDWVVVRDNEIIPLYQGKEIKELIRYYKDPTDNKAYIIEYWTSTSVLYFRYKENISPISEKPHYSLVLSYNERVEEVAPKAFKFVPFIPLYNNRNHESDAEDIIPLLKMYNSIGSGLVENIDLFQEAVVKLKNFSGDSDNLEDLLKSMKKYKAVGLPADGDIDYLRIDIPIEAREMVLTLLKDAIYTLGRAVDVDKVVSANNITNVYIKSRYQGLDFKANDTIRESQIFYRKLTQFTSSFSETNNADELVFNKTLVLNESEMIDTCVAAIALVDAGIVSMETIQKQIPWVVDIKKEQKQIEKEQAMKPEETTNNDLDTE